MLVFTFFVTINSEKVKTVGDAEKVIHDYFEFQNKKNVPLISQLLTNQNDISEIELKLKYTDKISLAHIKEETNESIIKAYLKHNKSIKKDNLKVYKVKYEVLYNSDAPKNKYKNGVYESWFFLIREKSDSNWLIDIS